MEDASQRSNETVYEDAVEEDAPERIDESIRQNEDEVNRTFSENPFIEEQQQPFQRPRPRSYQINAGGAKESTEPTEETAEK